MSEGNKKLLVVDDEPVARKVINFALKKHGYTVFESGTPQDALQKLNTEDIDLVYCDIMMEDMDGFEFCKKVRQQEKYNALPFIFITSMNSSEARSKAFDSGADDFIIKPVDSEELLVKTEALLKRIEIYKTYGLKKKFDDVYEKKVYKVLIVDDDPVIVKLLRNALVNLNFDCKIENNARDGFDAVKSYSPDIILSDYDMPEINGFEFRKMLLEAPNLKDIPFVFLTSQDSDKLMLEGYDMDIEEYILKTNHPKVVATKIGNIIKKINRERQKAVNELHQAAGSISMEVVPDAPPSFEGFKISQWHVPFKGIPGGDFIDYINIGDDRIVVILGDIMGKKWGAWFFAFSFISYIRSTIRVILKESKDCSSKEILTKINENIYNDAKISEIFTTLSLLILDKSVKSVQYSGAGDLPILYFSANSSEVEQLDSDGLLLGLKLDGEYKTVKFDIRSGDNIVVYTDGIIETRNDKGEQFGVKRLKDLVKKVSSGDDVIENIKKEFSEYSGNNFEDDVSLIVIKCS